MLLQYEIYSGNKEAKEILKFLSCYRSFPSKYIARLPSVVFTHILIVMCLKIVNLSFYNTIWKFYSLLRYEQSKKFHWKMGAAKDLSINWKKTVSQPICCNLKSFGEYQTEKCYDCFIRYGNKTKLQKTLKVFYPCATSEWFIQYLLMLKTISALKKALKISTFFNYF